jgi:hypothetical protein
MALPVEVRVYEDDNITLVASLNVNEATPANARQVRDLSGVVQLDDTGNGKLVVDYDHPQAGTLVSGRFVRVVEGSRVPLSFRIDKREDIAVPGAGASNKDRVVTVSGKGPRDILKYGRVLPWMAVGSNPLSRRRRFDWSSPELDTSDWGPIYDQLRTTSEPGKPFGIPSLFRTKWIAGEVEATSMTIGDTCYRREFTLASAATVSFFASWDDGGSQCLQGVELQDVRQTFPAKIWHTPYRAAVALDAGTYVYALRGTNEGGKAAVITDAWTTTEAGLIDQVFMSGLPEDFPGDDPGEYDFLYGDWLAFPNPQGEWFTPGEIARILLEECQDRGELLDVTLSCTDLLDSEGVAWDKIEFECDATGTYADAINALEASYVDVGMSNDGLVLSLYVKDGRGTATAVNASAADREIVTDKTTTDYEIVNDVLLTHDKGMYLYESPLSVLAYGRRPGGTLQVGSISDTAILDQIGAAYLDGRTNPAESRVVEVAPTFDLACDPGDTITVEGSTVRVTEIAYSLDQLDGRLRKVPVLSTAWEQNRERSLRSVERLIATYGESRASAQIIDTGTQIPTGQVEPVELESWSWVDGAVDLEPGWWDAAETDNPQAWQPHVVRKQCRVVAVIAKADWAEEDGAGGIDQVTTGESEFRLIVNRDPLWTGIPFIATLPETNVVDATDPTCYGIQYVLGEGILNPNDTVSVAPQLNGSHMNGSVAIWAVDV